jgi:hypothetical protein
MLLSVVCGPLAGLVSGCTVCPADGRLQDGPWQGRRASTKVTLGTPGCVAEHQGKRCPSLVNHQGGGAGGDEGRDWISLAGLAVSVIGFSVVVRELIRIAHAAKTGRARHRVSLKEADPLAGVSSS